MLQKKYYLFLLLSIFVVTANSLCAQSNSIPSDYIHEAITHHSNETKQNNISEEKNDDDLDELDILELDDEQVKKLAEAIEAQPASNNSPSLHERIKLALTYIKIKSLEAQEKGIAHIKENQTKYLVAISVTLALLASFYAMKVIYQKNQTTQD